MSTVYFWGVDPATQQATPDEEIERLALRYLSQTLPALYASTEGRDQLMAIYRCFARLDVVFLAVRERLADLLDPGECSSSYIDHLANAVGFDARTPWFSGLSDAAKRRFIVSAATIWQTKGTDLRYLVRAMLGGRVWVADWFALRYVVGGALPLVAMPPTGYEAYSFVHYVNPEGYDVSLIEAAVETVRQTGQTVVLHEVDWLDDLLGGLGQLDSTGPVDLEGDGWLAIGDGVDTASVETVNDGTGWAQHLAHLRLAFESATSVRLRTYMDGADDGFEVLVEPNGVASRLRLYDTTAPGVPLDDTGAVITIVPGYVYSIRIEHRAVANGTNVIVLLNGSKVLEYIPAPAGSSYVPGRWRVSAAAGSVVRMRLAEVVPCS